jgi:DNA mismatch endonuclease (patch repair protein)
MPDNLTPEQRKFCMSRVKSKDTSIERTVRSELHRLGYRFYKHVKALPGNPDVVFPRKRVVIFIDGDFWHGYRFPTWENQLTPFWRKKIAKTRIRDKRNFRKLRKSGWKVIRIWQHQVKKDLDQCVRIITNVVEQENNSQ